MTRRLATTVVLAVEDGAPITFREGSVPEEKYAALIRNPDCWVDDEDPVPAEQPSLVLGGSPPATPTLPAAGTPPASSGGSNPGGPRKNGEPARNGKTGDWKSYAEGLGQTVPENAGRDDIVAQLVAAGLIEE